jgi:hypothetical protein
MRKLWIVLALLVVVLPFTPAVAGDPDGHVNFFLGQKALDSDWDPVDQQPEFGAIMSFGKSDWPVFIAVDVMTSAEEKEFFDDTFGQATFTGGTYELAFGARKIWKMGSTHPYVGGGIAVIGATAEVDLGFVDVDADDSAIGPWVSGGVFWRLGNRFNLGFDLRYSSAEVDLDFGSGIVSQDVSAGGLHYGLLVGFGW